VREDGGGGPLRGYVIPHPITAGVWGPHHEVRGWGATKGGLGPPVGAIRPVLGGVAVTPTPVHWGRSARAAAARRPAPWAAALHRPVAAAAVAAAAHCTGAGVGRGEVGAPAAAAAAGAAKGGVGLVVPEGGPGHAAAAAGAATTATMPDTITGPLDCEDLQ
jgi:hypothetical protein